MPRDIVGFDPDNDRPLDPQQKDTFPGRCDWCGHLVYNGERFSVPDAPLWARKALGKDEIVFCSDCIADINNNKATWEGIRYGA